MLLVGIKLNCVLFQAYDLLMCLEDLERRLLHTPDSERSGSTFDSPYRVDKDLTGLATRVLSSL